MSAYYTQNASAGSRSLGGARMHTRRRGRPPPRAACVLVVLALAAMAVPSPAAVAVSDEAGRGLHSYTSHLNLSRV